MKGIVLAEEGHFVNALPPQDIIGGVTADRFTMKNYQHATIIVQVGAQTGDFAKIIVRECTAASGGSSTDIAFRLAAEETAGGDTLGDFESVASTGKTPSGNDNIFYVIELDASELTDGYPWVEVALTSGSNTVYASILVVLTGARYQEAQTRTAIA